MVTVAVLIPLIYYEALPKTQLTSFLVAPPPPPPPPPPPAAAAPVKVVKVIPRQFDAGQADGAEADPERNRHDQGRGTASAVGNAGVVGGVPGGVPGGRSGRRHWRYHRFGSDRAPPPPPPPPKEAPKPGNPQRIRVGGNVQSAKLVKQPKPAYPPLAKQARIQGVVRFTAVIGKDGTIQNLTAGQRPSAAGSVRTEAVRSGNTSPRSSTVSR